MYHPKIVAHSTTLHSATLHSTIGYLTKSTLYKRVHCTQHNHTQSYALVDSQLSQFEPIELRHSKSIEPKSQLSQFEPIEL